MVGRYLLTALQAGCTDSEPEARQSSNSDSTIDLGSSSVRINGKPAALAENVAGCVNETGVQPSLDVYINGLAAARAGDLKLPGGNAVASSGSTAEVQIGD